MHKSSAEVCPRGGHRMLRAALLACALAVAASMLPLTATRHAAATVNSLRHAPPAETEKKTQRVATAWAPSHAAPQPGRMATLQSKAGSGVDAPGSTTQASNVLGGPLGCCCTAPKTGFYRDGFCRTGGGDYGVHVVCAQVTAEFLAFTAAHGNDLSSPAPQYGFPGLKPGDRWCLCASRWKEAADAGAAPPVLLSATHVRALDYVDLELLKAHALPEEEDSATAA